jgi:hypothetical protein
MKPLFGVIFSPDAPIDLTIFGGEPFEFSSIKTMALTCTEVHETSYGFLHLVPRKTDVQQKPLTLFVPPSYILWMAQADSSGQLGFLSAPQK